MQYKSSRVSNNILAFLVVVFVLTSFYMNWQIITLEFLTGKTTEQVGSISVCVNSPPTISHSCTLTAYVGQEYTCDIDAVKGTNENLTFYDYTDLFDINESTGIFKFTPTSAQEGSHLINITVYDNSSCTNNDYSEIINLTITSAYCGDGTCGADESCSSCPQDCGACPAEEPPAEPTVKKSGGGGAGVTRFGIDFTIVDEKIVTGYVGDKISFTFNGVTPHYINIMEVEEQYIVVTIDSGEQITARLKELTDIDMNGDGLEDIKIYLMDVDENKKAKMKVIKGSGADIVGKQDVLPLKIEPESIKVLLRVGTTFEQILKLKNLARYDFNIVIDPKNLAKFVEVSESEFIMLAMQEKEITLKFMAALDQQPGVYTGKIFVEAMPSPGWAEPIFKTIPTIIEIESKDVLFDATLEIPLDYKEVLPGQEVKGLITIFNLKKIRPVEISVDYIIKDMYGNVIAREKDVLSVEEQVSFEKMVRIPEDAKEGDYIFIVQTRYGESFSTTSQKFFVGKGKAKRIEETKKIVEEVQKTYNLALFAGIAVLLAISVFMFVHYRKRIGRIEKESKEKIMKRLEELERKYEKEFRKAEEFAKEEEEKLGLDKLADFIKDHLDRGYNKEEVSKHLKKHGWKEHHIHHAMRKASKKRLENEMGNLRKMLK